MCQFFCVHIKRFLSLPWIKNWFLLAFSLYPVWTSEILLPAFPCTWISRHTSIYNESNSFINLFTSEVTFVPVKKMEDVTVWRSLASLASSWFPMPCTHFLPHSTQTAGTMYSKWHIFSSLCSHSDFSRLILLNGTIINHNVLITINPARYKQNVLGT